MPKRRKIHGEVPHWLCVHCAAAQPGFMEDPPPESCWSCGFKEFIRDSFPPLYADEVPV